MPNISVFFCGRRKNIVLKIRFHTRLLKPRAYGLWLNSANSCEIFHFQLLIYNILFKHPISNNDIFVFADVPHLLKLIRDTGLLLQDGNLINKNPLGELLKLTDTEVNLCYKLSKKHTYRV
jgi:hypothetical protein